jgi:hypothetical protein
MMGHPVTKTTTYSGTDCHKWARRAINAGKAVFGIDSIIGIKVAGQWGLSGFPVTLNDEDAVLSQRGVYVQAPGGMTQQFLSPLLDSELSITFEFYADWLPPKMDPKTMQIELDEDCPECGASLAECNIGDAACPGCGVVIGDGGDDANDLED